LAAGRKSGRFLLGTFNSGGHGPASLPAPSVQAPVPPDLRCSDFQTNAYAHGFGDMPYSEQPRERLVSLAPDAVIDDRPEVRHYIADAHLAILPFLLDANGLKA